MSTTYSLPEDAVIHCALTASPTTPVNGMTSYTRGVSKNKTSIAVFMNANKINNFGPRDVSFTLEGLYSQDDPGQAILRGAAESGAGVYLKLLPNGTDGVTGYYLVGSMTNPGDAENRPKQTFELALEGSVADTTVGAGL